MALQIIAIAILIQYATGEIADKPYAITKLNSSGIFFEDLGSLMVYHNTWNVLTEIDLDELDTQIKLTEHAEYLVHKLCINITDKEDLCNVQQLHIHAIIDSVQKRTRTIKELVPGRRKARSLFDGIGNAMHYLFGTMDSNNEKEIYSRLDEIESNTQALAELEKQQISVVKTTLEQIQKPLAMLIDRQQNIAHQINDLHTVTEDLTRRQLRQEIISSLLLQIIEVEYRQQALLDIIIATKGNHIHPLLVSPKNLLDVYRKSTSKCLNDQNCLSILYQSAGAQSRLMQNKLVVRITLPIFDSPKMRLRQVRCFPVPQPANYSIIPDPGYSCVANSARTQEFLLLKGEDMKSFKKVTHSLEENTYIGRLNTPIIKATTSDECIVKVLYNPLNEVPKCRSRVQVPQKDMLIKLNKPNAWLFSFITSTVLHITCRDHFAISKLEGQGILEITQPCQVQIGEKVLRYEGENKHPLKITQPKQFPELNHSLLNLNLAEILPKSQNQSVQTEIITGDDINKSIYTGTHSLEDIQHKLDQYSNKVSSRQSHILSTTSLSFTSLLVLAIMIAVAVKYLKPVVIKIKQQRNQPQGNPEVLSEGIPLEERTPAPQPSLRRARSLPKTKSVQIV